MLVDPHPACKRVLGRREAALRARRGARDAPDGDALEALWRSYYKSIFNPARLKLASMQGHMPKKYWANLPEAELIPSLVSEAAARAGAMIDAGASTPRRRIAKYVGPPIAGPASGSLGGLRAAAAGCQACPLWEHATQTVFGEGPADADVMFVGEQPGDQEDLAGKPFVGPAGRCSTARSRRRV